MSVLIVYIFVNRLIKTKGNVLLNTYTYHLFQFRLFVPKFTDTDIVLTNTNNHKKS